MRTCYIHGKTSLKHTHMIQSEKLLSKYLIRPDFTKNVGFVRSCARVRNNRVSLRRKFGRIPRWYLCLPDKMSSKPLINEDHMEEPDMPLIHGDGALNVVDHAQEDHKMIWFYFFKNGSNVFKADELGLEIAIIALPALVALAADPLASLVDTAFIGQLGSVELAAVGVAIAIFNLVSKLLNVPVLNLTTSYVAEESIDSANIDERTSDTFREQDSSISDETSSCIIQKKLAVKQIDDSRKKSLPAVSTALVVACTLGFFELILLTTGSGPILDIMGVPIDSNMRLPAQQYLTLRALGSPAVVVSLATQGVFRGFKDTKTPLYATVSGNIINMVLVPILIFSLGYGVGGAAVATVISEYFIALVLLWKMSEKVVLLPPKLSDLEYDRFLKNGGLLLARSTAAMLCLTLATSQAAKQGAIPMAAHQICMQTWLAASLLSDAIALAGQAIIASSLAKGDYELAKATAFRTLQMGCAFGFTLLVFLGLGLSMFSKLFTNDPQVLEFLVLGIPFVAATQPINSLAFVFDGLYFGALDFGYAAQSMIIVTIICSIFMVIAAPTWGFSGIWTGLTMLMTLRMFAGFLRVGTATGPWKFLSETQEL